MILNNFQIAALKYSCLVLTDLDFPYALSLFDIELTNLLSIEDVKFAPLVIYEGVHGTKILKMRYTRIYRSTNYT